MSSLTKLDQRRTLRLCTAGSVDDGKSTFVGRLLHDTKSVLADQLEQVERSSADRGFSGVDYSLLVDGLRAEREQGITIDVAYRYFATDRRTFILADTPGHVQYTRNTVTGMSTAEVVVLLIDARHGVVEQTIKHLSVAGLLGVDTVILAVNKIDLVDYSRDVFDAIATEFEAQAQRAGVPNVHLVPISALHGDNVVAPSTNVPWYTGPTILELLETIEPEDTAASSSRFRFPIQYIIREHASDYRGYAGRVSSGRIAVGDPVRVGEHLATTVVGIDSSDGPLEVAAAGDSVVLRLADNVDLARGDLISDEESRPELRRSFHSRIVSLSETPLNPGQIYKLRYGTSAVRAKVTTDGPFQLNDIAGARIDLAEGLPVEAYAHRGGVGSFLIVDAASGDPLAAGLVED